MPYVQLTSEERYVIYHLKLVTGFFMAPSSQELEPPQNPGRFSLRQFCTVSTASPESCRRTLRSLAA